MHIILRNSPISQSSPSPLLFPPSLLIFTSLLPSPSPHHAASFSDISLSLSLSLFCALACAWACRGRTFSYTFHEYTILSLLLLLLHFITLFLLSFFTHWIPLSASSLSSLIISPSFIAQKRVSSLSFLIFHLSLSCNGRNLCGSFFSSAIFFPSFASP